MNNIADSAIATGRDGSPATPASRTAGLAAAGGVLGALVASTCCIVPLVLFTLGISGAWISNVTALEPYQPIFFATTAGFLGVGYSLVYRRQKVACANGTCAQPLPTRVVKAALWVATALVIAAAAFRYLASLLLGA
ncbi:MAG: mercury transporter MerT [Alphaproteobacteria bacterium]|nr:mercury transporter MerT [Alphaproteobacteria bacterium]